MGEKLRFGALSVELSHLDKVYFPSDGIRKGEVIEYYRDVAETLVPYVKERPLTMRRFPEGIAGEGFFHQQAAD